MRSVSLHLAAVVGLLFALGGCAVEPYCLECQDDLLDGGRIDALDTPRDTAGSDVQPVDAPPDVMNLPDGCTPGAPELCNAYDDDCDTLVDEGIDTATDEMNCGGCGRACAPPNAFGECTGGTCSVTSCDVGYFDRDGNPANGCEVRCIETEPVEMTCNRRDDDCDGMIDEPFDLNTDPVNCGACGRICRAPHAGSMCSAGACTLGACEPGYIDLDGLEGNGCEFGCVPADPAVETCNLRDDDCDGLTDEGNPGAGASCGDDTGACSFGTINCVGGTLTCTGGASPSTELCNSEDDDCDGLTDENNPEGGRACGSAVGSCVPGRETCTSGALTCVGAIGPSAELCNALDDNCDGTIDDGNPEGGASCGSDTGECIAGALTCSGGGLSCVGSRGPALDVCNMLDDDCDGVADQTFNLVTDPNNCGMCGRRCMLPNAISGCAVGSCTFVACRPGFVNADGNTANGCEYACVPSGAETCNGVDDNCNGTVDEGVVAPSGFCNPNGVCALTGATCSGAGGWVCNYPATYQAAETRCDSLDNDCNGVVDDGYNIGTSCTNGEIGACRRTGTIACTSMTASACNAPASGGGSTELCNNVDDDCNGTIDNGVMGNWVPFTTSGGTTNYIMAYEASRPDSTATSAGVASHRVCSESGRVPWTTITHDAAELACATLGATLCTETQWQRACESSAAAGSECLWSEATTCRTFDTLCNTNEFDSSAAAGDQDALMTTGAMMSCYTPWTVAATTRNLYDMSGNVQEWTRERAAAVNPMRGGTYLDPMGGATCQTNFEVASDTIALPTVGFRCCRTTPP